MKERQAASPRTPRVFLDSGVSFLALFLCAGLAHASLTAAMITPPSPVEGGFEFNYQITMPRGERLDPPATAGASCRGPGTSVVPCDPPGTFFTIYDIPGLVRVELPLISPGWTYSVQAIGVTPSAVNASFDNASLSNVTFTYSGPIMSFGQTTPVFAGFKVVSTFGARNFSGHYSSQNTHDSGGVDVRTVVGVGSVSVPAIPNDGTLASADLRPVGGGGTPLDLERSRSSTSPVGTPECIRGICPPNTRPERNRSGERSRKA